MAVDIQGFDIVFSASNANHARAIDQSIARMSEKVPTLSMGISDMAKALETLGKLNIDGVKKNLDAVKYSIENIDGSKLDKVFDLATAKSEGLLNSFTALVNMLGKVDSSTLGGMTKGLANNNGNNVVATKDVAVIPMTFDERTILSEIKIISDRLAMIFKDIPVSLRKELDLNFFAEKANELKKMFAGITVTGIQSTSAKKTENTLSTTKFDAGSSRLSSDSALVIEAAFERMNNLTNALIEKIRSIGTAENELFSNLRTDIQGVSTSLQGLVDQLSKVHEKSTRKKSAKKDNDAIVTEREVALTKEELARLDDLNAKLAKSNDLLAKKRTKQDAIVKATGTRDVFLNDEISRLETKIKAYNKAKQDLLVPKHGVAPSQSVVETQQAENAQLKLVKEVEEEANARQKNIAYLTQMISMIERMLKYGNFGQGVDMFSGMQQYLVDVQAKMKSLLKEQRTTTEQQIAQQNKATEDMALSYLKMINVQIEAAKRKEREEQAYRERVLAAERAFHQERQKLYESLFGKGGEKDKQDAQIKKAQQWYTKDAEMRQRAEENAHNAIQILIAKAEAQRIASKEYEDKLNEQFYEKEKKRLYDLYKEQLKLKGKIGSLNNQRTIVSERSQGTITALSPKQEQLAKEYAQQLAKVNAEISRTASLVGYVDAQNAKESTRVALLEQEIKLQKELDKALEKIYAEQQKKSDAANVGLSASQIKSLENEYARLLTQIDKVNAARREMNEKQGVAWSTGNTQAFAQLSSGIQAADKEIIRLNERKAQLENESQLQLDKIRDTHERKRGEQAVKDFEKAEREKTQIAEREAKKRADEEKKKIQDYKSQNLAQNTSLTGAAEFAKTSNTINRLQTALKYLQDALSKTKPNTPEWNNANKVYQETKKRLDDIKKSMESVKTQTNSIIPNLQNLAMQFGLVFSIQQLNQWVQHMVEVRAQFELQQIALRSIIQDKQKADEVFAQVQQLALKSPFSIMELNRFTKQMAAYGVEADKLVGTTKQLADVSAGLGVDMGRLILAYGQVKTANYLRATEVRQFTEAGLNITQELANYFTELNGKMVTAGEVTEMITKRMVKFEDVAEVFKRVTSAGGMFYEMQEKQSEGLKGQMQRIGDAYSIMLNDIGKSHQGTIAAVLSTIRNIISSWRSIASYITVAAKAAAAYIGVAKFAAIVETLNKTAAGYKLVAFATNSATAAQLKNNAAVVANPYALAAAAIALVVAGIYEWATATDQLTEDLQRMQEETFADATDAVSNYQKLADTVRDVTKSYSERKEAMDEIQRSYGDILPMQQLEMDGIMSISDGYKEATDAIREYYRIRLEEEEKSKIEANYSSKFTSQSKSITDIYANILKDVGGSSRSIQGIIDDVINKLKDGSISNAKDAGQAFVDELVRYYNITDQKLKSKMIAELVYRWDDGWVLRFGAITRTSMEYKKAIGDITGMNEKFADITDERTHAALQLINKDFEQVEERVKKVGLAFSQLDNLRTLNERAGGTGFDIAKIETAVSDKKTGNLTAEEQKVAAALQEIDKALASIGMTGKYAWQQIYDATANNIAQTGWFGTVQKTAFTSFLQNLNQAKYHTNELAKAKFAETLQAKIDSVDGSPTVKEIRRIVKAVADANKLDYHLFDWLTLDVKTSFESAGKEFDTQLKAFHEKILAYKDMMKIMYLTGQSEQDILKVLGLTKEQIDNSLALEDAYKKIITALGKPDKENEKKPKKPKVADKTEQTLRERIKLIKEANQTFEKYAKEYDKVIAKEKTYKDLMDRAKELNIADILRKDDLTNTATLDAMQNVYNKFKSLFEKKKYVGAKRDALKEMSDMKFEIAVELNENNRKELQDSFDKMFGDYQLFIELDKIGINQNLAKDMFDIDYTSLDEIGARWKQLFLDNINNEYKQMDKSFAGFKTYEEAKAKLSQEKSNKNYEMAVNTEKKISEAFNKELESREKEYAKYLKKSYSDSVNEQVKAYRQLIQLQMDADFKRNAIIGNDKLDDKQKQTALQELDAMSSQIATKMQEELQKKLNKIQWESFKDSPLFETVLSDIEHLSTGTIGMLINKMEELKKTYKGLDPKIVKELTKYTDQLTKQKINNNPFKEWGNALREINKLKKDGLTLDKLNENLISESDELTRLNAELESYNKVLAIKQQMTHVTEKDIQLMRTDTQTLERQLRVLEEQKSKKSVSGAGVDGSDESKSLDLQIKKIQEILAARRTILASNGDNVVLSSQEIALLQQESKEITNQVLELAKKKGLKEEDIEKIKAQIGSWDKLSESQKGAISILNEVGSAASAGFAVAEAAMDAFGGSSDEVTKAMLQGFDDCIQSVISLTVAIVSFNTAANAASGIIGIIAASLTAVATLFKTIFNVHEAKLEKSIKEHQRQLKKLEAEYDNLSDAISNAFSGFQLGTNTQAAIQNLEKQNEQYRAMIENEKDKKDSDEDQIADWQQTIADNLKKAQELRQQYFNELGGLGTGSDVRDAAEGFVDAWADAFGETSDGISGLKKQFNDFMKNIVKKQAYMKIADHWINKFGDMINASFDKYGQVNYEKLQQAMQWFTEEAMPQMDTALEDMNAFWERLGINWTGTTSNLSGLAAGIQGVTEETAQILEALLNSMRFYVADTNEQLKSILNTMNGANEENPFLKELKNQTKYLASIDKRLDSVISATKRSSGSHINVFTT